MDAVLIVAAAGALVALIGSGIGLQRARERRLRRKRAMKIEDAVMIGGQAAVKGAIRTAARVREEGMGAMLKAPVEALATWADVEHPELRRISRDGTVSILFSDIEDSTALNHELGDRRWLKVLGAHDELVEREVKSEGGHVIKHQGDGFMIAFGEAGEALRCAVAIQRGLASGRGPLKKTPLKVRIGIHSGEAVAKRGDLYGRNVARAARVAEQAVAGQILVSAEVQELAVTERAGSDEADSGDQIRFGTTRAVELKGLGSQEVVDVDWQPAP